ncbi:protein-glutamate methylesterase/protein-glutamine glutaminase [Stakelama marina]|uniref:Protein-glutamate methylesterase/protein-glutamine glutaminase n=1 Tax=Stakelama marina TaxID=2826939 RepID=A0A8T4I8Y1_9SPHN|nr:chemotaxis response regulator protein-glutamate methylesterase [Stakelama marina]MBR0550960.1 chemotaxis response regulator protein-glutamate methylesterase [Stakelama marina]
MTRPIRTLIVDDSATISSILEADPEIEVVGAAPEPNAARAMIKELNPDVVTLDVEMPGMDGLSFLEKIMRLRPMPVVMCSTLTARGAEVTIEALRLGATDCVEKPSAKASDLAEAGNTLRDKVKAAAQSTVRRINQPERITGSAGGIDDRVIAIGASTGGVEALFTILPALPADTPPILIVQHMPPAFTTSFASRLDGVCAMRVVEATDRTPIARGTVYIAPGGDRHMTLANGPRGNIRLIEAERVSGHRPSVDMLFRSVVPLGRRAVGVILTGMGDDGADGLLAMRQAGASTLGQNAASCVVHGMPGAAAARGAVERELGLSALPEAILAACRKN